MKPDLFGEGVRGKVFACSAFWNETFVCRGWIDHHADIDSGSFGGFRSDNELLRFFFDKTAGLLGAASPIVLSVLKLRCELPGRERYSSEADGLGRGGKSLETGRDGGSMRVSVSVDRDLTKDVFGGLAGWD